MNDAPARADGAAVFTCFTIPGIIAGSLVGAVTHGEGPGVWKAAAKGGFWGGGGATLLGTLVAMGLRAGIDARAAA